MSEQAKALLPDQLRERARVSEARGYHSTEWCNGVRFAANEIEKAALSAYAQGEAVAIVGGDTTLAVMTKFDLEPGTKLYAYPTPPAPSAADAELTEEQKAAQDLRLYGTSFMRDGKRIDPQDVWIATPTEDKGGAWPDGARAAVQRMDECRAGCDAGEPFYADAGA